jgi:hypothetical protein
MLAISAQSAILSAAFAAALAAAPPIPAQTAATASPPHTPATHRAHPAKPSPSVLAAQPAPAPPSAPKQPDWPANDPPAQANVVWDSHGLSIQAANSSLDQILKDVSTETGARVEGFSKDQRIFGSYGPGSTREVLSQLLDGSGYNLLMVGGRSADDPLHVVLSTRPVGAPPPVEPSSRAEADNDIAPEEPEQQQPQPPVPIPARMDNNPAQQPRTPQQIMQEMLQRQQQQQQHNSPF